MSTITTPVGPATLGDGGIRPRSVLIVEGLGRDTEQFGHVSQGVENGLRALLGFGPPRAERIGGGALPIGEQHCDVRVERSQAVDEGLGAC